MTKTISGRADPVEVFSGWKDIATYLGKGVRTIQRYEQTVGLPIRRPAGKLSGSVIATKVELNAWLAGSPLRNDLRESPSRTDARVQQKSGKTESPRQ